MICIKNNFEEISKDTLEKLRRKKGEISKILKDNYISSGIHYPRGLHQQPIFEELYGQSELIHTKYLSEHILAIPVHHGLRENDINIVKGDFFKFCYLTADYVCSIVRLRQ